MTKDMAKLGYHLSLETDRTGFHGELHMEKFQKENVFFIGATIENASGQITYF